MGARAIICLGNRYVAGDAIGCRVFDHLSAAPPQPGVDVIDGGLCGLDLLSLLQGRTRVVFADAMIGMAPPGSVVVLDGAEVARLATGYGHSAGLPYLLRMMAEVVPPPWPQIAVVGAEGVADAATVQAVAERCAQIASHGQA